MKLSILLLDMLAMLLIMQLNYCHVRALARKQLTQLPTPESGFEHALLAIKKRTKDYALEVPSIEKTHNVGMDTIASSSTHDQTNTKRTLTSTMKREERWLVADDVDYLGPRTHSPTKPPRR